MGNQEMQFADPDWKPSQQLDTKANPHEQEMYQPQPINADYREQNRWRTAAPSSPQQEGYTGLHPYEEPIPAQMQGGKVRQRPYRRRGRGPWLWIILAFIIFGLMSGGFHSFKNFDPNNFGNRPPIEKTYTYTVNGLPTINVNDPTGTVQVNVSKSNSNVVIQTNQQKNFFDNANVAQTNIIQSANTITANEQGSADLQITVPQGANLNLQTVSGDITVNGVDGQMTLTSVAGNIHASNGVMSGTSTITTGSGDIGFDGTFNNGGTYLFKTGRGNVDFTVPSSQAFHLDATTTSGSFDKGSFTSISVQQSDSVSGTKASGDVGTSSQVQGPKVTINTDNGDINLHQR